MFKPFMANCQFNSISRESVDKSSILLFGVLSSACIINTHTYIYMCVYVYICIYVCVCWVCVCVYIRYMCVCSHIEIGLVRSIALTVRSLPEANIDTNHLTRLIVIN